WKLCFICSCNCGSFLRYFYRHARSGNTYLAPIHPYLSKYFLSIQNTVARKELRYTHRYINYSAIVALARLARYFLLLSLPARGMPTKCPLLRRDLGVKSIQREGYPGAAQLPLRCSP